MRRAYILVVDRLKELIKYKGMQVAPAEIEGVLLTHPAIADAAVIGIPDEGAARCPRRSWCSKTRSRLKRLCNTWQRRWRSGKGFAILEIVDAIPKSSSGKILRRMLVE